MNVLIWAKLNYDSHQNGGGYFEHMTGKVHVRCWKCSRSFFVFLALPNVMWDLSSLTRNGTHPTALLHRVLTTGPPEKSWNVLDLDLVGGYMMILFFFFSLKGMHKEFKTWVHNYIYFSWSPDTNNASCPHYGKYDCDSESLYFSAFLTIFIRVDLERN